MKAASTMVAVIGHDPGPVITRVAAVSANVAVETAGDLPSELGEIASLARATWEKAMHHRLIYTLVDVDPLAPVVSQWSRRLLGESHELEMAIASAALVELPDFYFVDEHLGPPAIDWYLGNLRHLRPSRVVPIKLEPGSVATNLAVLPSGKEFPPGREVAALARDFVPVPRLD